MPRLVLGIVIAVIFILSFSTAVLSIGLPDPTQLSVQRQLESTKVLDRNGVVLFDIFGEKRRANIPLTDIPEHLKQATIAAEDSDFYTHKGFDIKGFGKYLRLKTKTPERNISCSQCINSQDPEAINSISVP